GTPEEQPLVRSGRNDKSADPGTTSGQKVQEGDVIPVFHENGRSEGDERPLPDNAIGFRTNSAEVDHIQLQRVLNNLPDDIRQALGNKGTTLYVDGMASPVGTDEHNLRLSQMRAENVAGALRNYYGVEAKIVCRGLGEAPAQSKGKNENSNDPE